MPPPHLATRPQKTAPIPYEASIFINQAERSSSRCIPCCVRRAARPRSLGLSLRRRQHLRKQIKQPSSAWLLGGQGKYRTGGKLTFEMKFATSSCSWAQSEWGMPGYELKSRLL